MGVLDLPKKGKFWGFEPQSKRAIASD